MILEDLKKFQAERLADLASLSSLAQDAWHHGRLPSLAEVEPNVLYTALGTVALAQFILVLLTRSGRRVVFLTADTILAVLLLVILLGAILSLPLGAVYIGLRGSLLMARSLCDNFPAVAVVLRPMLAALGQAGAVASAAAADAAAAAGAAAR
ncbi:hypothetical protein HYH03_017752 [Edaphochlamys debaryana]|uniref:Uncharacterized protein n=1 Tax=Edaphochlamys debaryana TaxID=47281 RepID=A0A836BNV4_9CHLO|nr:hypothetical protein HYH03_017752 [Edaphochlamys debaryana]|eukprot:KAG2483400.1 hypothetical protein HYH03_017752 [Edaphochlamys debaryana]